jgi:hypothetical protein
VTKQPASGEERIGPRVDSQRRGDAARDQHERDGPLKARMAHAIKTQPKSHADLDMPLNSVSGPIRASFCSPGKELIDVNKVSKLMSSQPDRRTQPPENRDFKFKTLVDPRGFEPLTF